MVISYNSDVAIKFCSLSKNPIGDQGFITLLDVIENSDTGLKGLG